MAVGKGEYVQVLSDSTMPLASKCNETAFMLHTIVGSMIWNRAILVVAPIFEGRERMCECILLNNHHYQVVIRGLF